MTEKHRVRPNGNRVLVKPDVQDKTAGGIILTDQTKENCRRGRIVAVGCGKLNEAGGTGHAYSRLYFPLPPGIEPGAMILYGRYAASDSKELDDLKGHVIVDVDSIIGVIEKE